MELFFFSPGARKNIHNFRKLGPHYFINSEVTYQTYLMKTKKQPTRDSTKKEASFPGQASLGGFLRNASHDCEASKKNTISQIEIYEAVTSISFLHFLFLFFFSISILWKGRRQRG